VDHAGRLRRTRTALAERDLDALLVGPSPDLRWLVGYNAPPLERLTLLVVPADGEPSLVVPTLEAARAAASGAGDHAEIVTWDEHEDPVAIVEGRTRPATRLAVGDHLWATFLLQLQAALPDARWVRGSSVTGPLRARKAPEEIEALRAAGEAIDAVHARVPELLSAGRTEREVGRDIADLVNEGHDEMNFVIVASGPNGASPHHEARGRRISRGDTVVVDIGGTLDGYCSDSTRNYSIGGPTEDYVRLHEVLEVAQQAGVDVVAPGVPAETVDEACRRAIVAAGHGDHFIHRTGHGIGVEAHEEPYIVAGNRTELAPGMAFSVEPGIYVPDRYGARIEDIVVVTDDGVERLNHRPRELLEVGA
jgi:Xaa-Pro aminopeptidase